MAKITQVFELKTETNDAVNDIKKLDKDMTHLADTIGVEVSGSISAMEDKLYELALAGETNTKEFKELQEQTARYKQIVIETDRSIDALAEQGRGLSNALSLAEGTVAGYQAFASVSALVGEENEELLETMTKLQAAQGALNSIQVIRQQLQEKSIAITRLQAAAQTFLNKAIGNGTKATKAFRVALLATGIGALIVGITALIANWDKLTAALGGATKAQKLQNDVMNQAVEAASEELSAIDQVTKKLDDENLSREEKNKAVKDLQAEYPSLLKNMDIEKTSIEDLNKALQANFKLVQIKAQLDALQALRAEEYQKVLKNQIDAQDGATTSMWDYVGAAILGTNAQESANAQLQKSTDEANKSIVAIDGMTASLEAQEKAVLRQIDFLDGGSKAVVSFREAASGQIKKIEDRADAFRDRRRQERLAKEKAFQDALFKLQQDEAARMNALLDEIAQTEENFLTSERDKELNAVTDHYFRLIEEAKFYGQDTTILEQAREKALQEIRDKFQTEELEKRKAAQTQIIDNNLALMDEGQEKELAQIRENFSRQREEVKTNEELNAEERRILLRQLKVLELEELNAISEQYAEEEKQMRINKFNEYSATVIEGINAISSINELASELAIRRAEGDQAKQEKIARRAFNVNKALQLAIATVQGIQAVQNAYTGALLSPIYPVNPSYPFVMAGIAAATSAANIAKIASARFEGGGGSVAPSGGAVQGASASSFAIGDNTSTEQTNLNPDGTQAGGQGQPVQVFVTESDITETQDNVQQINTLSTF